MDTVQQQKIRLSQLEKGSRALIVEHEESAFKLTLMDMGCIPGEPV
jgi:Fe2+ transport system protein FeoA